MFLRKTVGRFACLENHVGQQQMFRWVDEDRRAVGGFKFLSV